MMSVNSTSDNNLVTKSDMVEIQNLQRALDFERRRSQGLESELTALQERLKLPINSNSRETEDNAQIRTLGIMRDAMAATKFHTLRTVIPTNESFTGSRNVVIPWNEITPGSVVHVSACEAAELPDTALEDQIGVPGDAPILVRGGVCGNGIVVVNIHVDWVKPLPLLISVTLLSASSQFVFCNVEPQKSLLATPELEHLLQAQVYNLTGVDNDSDDDFVEWAYRRILGRPADESGKMNWVQSIQRGHVTRAQLITELVKSEEYEIRNSYHYKHAI
jgi:hypothetical protein